MREQRQKASQATPASQTMIGIPWQSQSRTTIPEPLPEWPRGEGAIDLRARDKKLWSDLLLMHWSQLCITFQNKRGDGFVLLFLKNPTSAYKEAQ